MIPHSRTDIDLTRMAGTTRPLWLRPRRRRIDWLGVLAGIVGLLVIAGTLVFVVVALANTTT